MKRHVLLSLLTLINLLLNGCSTTTARSDAATAQATQPLLLFQKSPCLGPCPAYDATIYENGSISFVEFKNALTQDTIQLQLTEEELQQLKRRMEALNYQELQNNYLSNWSDISSTYLTFYKEGREAKQVKHEKGGPQRLIEFQEWLHSLLWQRADEQKRPTY